jgi:peptide/nickel transport system substrate-binding protein
MAWRLSFFLMAWHALAIAAADTASAQQQGGTLRVYHRDSPASMSVIEEASLSTAMPMMGVFNNLAMYDQHVAQNSLATIVPDLAESWSWSEDGTALTFRLRDGVRWHDGKPFTARDVQCTWDLLLGTGPTPLRANPRKFWWQNVASVTAGDERAATFHLKRPQPALLALLASGYSPVYPCHVTPAQMRQHPIGTGPFKFFEYKPNQGIKVARNPDYWKPGRPHLDAIEYTIIPNRSTAVLAFAAGKFDLTWPYDVAIPLVREVKAQAPQAICEVAPLNASRNLDINPAMPPFDNPELRRAMSLSLDRRAFIDILDEGQGDIGGAMLPPPAGVWGLTPEMLRTLPGYGPDIAKNREAARAIMERLGYGPDRRLAVKVASRNIPIARDPAIILIDQLKTIYIDGELDLVDTALWFPKMMRHDYAVALGLGASGVDDPDQQFYQNYACGSDLNVTGYCNRDMEKLFERQSVEADQQQRKELVWEIDRRLQ